MVPALAILLGALSVSVIGPRLLDTLERKSGDSGLALGSWMVTILGVAISAVLGVVLILIPGHGAATVGLVYSCWTSLQHGQVPRLDEIVGALATALLIALALRLLVEARRASRRRRRMRSHLDALTVTGRTDSAGTLWVPAAHPAAFSVRAGRGKIVATTALQSLPIPTRDAVLDHERAHLSGRHHLLVAAVDALAAAAPPLPLFRQAPSAVRRLIELAADRASCRRHGPGAVREALILVATAGATPPAESLGMVGEGTVAARIAALDTAAGRASSYALVRGAAAGATALLPLATASGLLSVLALVSCS